MKSSDFSLITLINFIHINLKLYLIIAKLILNSLICLAMNFFCSSNTSMIIIGNDETDTIDHPIHMPIIPPTL